ncbi:MAG: hypothetical protein LC803_18435 [Acidobacteria bacterium]|nr:hypothetical protein [Acidobacteriota bacterium]
MATYSEWNKAIIEYFVSGLPEGSTVYLSIDEDALLDIGQRFLRPGAGSKDWVEDFLLAVRGRCVVDEEVRLDRVRGTAPGGLPNCVAFLGVMVLAAHRMVDEEAITESNYFTPLRRVLDLPDNEFGRPRGLQSGTEESLWFAWNRWIVVRGFLPSAERGKGRTNKFIHYPRSQALLREGDKRRLTRVFREAARSRLISKEWDKNKLSTWLRMNIGIFNTQHLKELFQEADPSRYEAIMEVVFNLYDTLDWADEEQPRAANTLVVQRRIIAGLYRIFEPTMGSISYLLYPRKPAHWNGSNLHVLKDSESHSLREDRSGWFMPLWSEPPSGGSRYEVRGNVEVKEIILPESDFWIFVRDPESEDSGVFASWRRPAVFENFVLLCRKERTPDMETLRQAGLLSWDYEFHLSEHNLGWVEYRDCVITSLDWDEVLSNSNDMFDALRPSVSAITIALRGGLRVPDQRGWLEGYGPEVVIYAVDEQLRLVARDIVNIDTPIWDRTVKTNQYLELKIIARGDYILQVYRGSRLIAQQAFRILPWSTLRCSEPKKSYSVRLGNFTLEGALVRVDGEGPSG